MYMDHIKIFAKNEKELTSLIEIIRIFSQDIGMELELKICHAYEKKKRKKTKKTKTKQ